MMNVADRKHAKAPAEARAWLATLRSRVAGAGRGGGGCDCSCADGLWRDVLAFTWNIQTMAGRAAIETTLRETLARTQPTNFSFPQSARRRAGFPAPAPKRIEAIFDFETAFGPGNGVLRLVPDPQAPVALARLDAQHQFA